MNQNFYTDRAQDRKVHFLSLTNFCFALFGFAQFLSAQGTIAFSNDASTLVLFGDFAPTALRGTPVPAGCFVVGLWSGPAGTVESSLVPLPTLVTIGSTPGTFDGGVFSTFANIPKGGSAVFQV